MDELLQKYNELRDSLYGLFPNSDTATLIIGIIATLLITVIFLIGFFVTRRIFSKIQVRIRSWEGTRIKSWTFQKQEILSAEDITDILSGLVRACYYVLILVAASIYINLSLGFFPWTQDWSALLFGYIGATLSSVAAAIVGYLPNLILIVVILFLVNYLIKFTRLIFNGISKGRIRLPGFYPEWASPTFNILRLMFIALTVVIIFPYLPGSTSPAFQGVSIFVGVLLSLGSTAAVSNVVAGVVITYMRAFKIGDRVKIADTVGDVVEKSLFVTRVRTTKNVEIAVPNSMVLANHIINYSTLSRNPGLILHTTVTIGYDVPRDKVEDLLIAAAKKTEKLKEKPEPFILHTSLDDFYVSYELNAYTAYPQEMSSIYSNLHQNILDSFHSAGIEITSPHYAAIRDGNMAAIPEDYLPKDYEPPPFRVHPLEKLFDPNEKK